MKRRILIIGQGNIGSFLGVALQQCPDNDVFHFVRNNSEKSKKVILNFSDRRKTNNKIPKNSQYNYQQINTPNTFDTFNFIFIPVRHTQWKKTIEDIRQYMHENQTVILCGNILDDFDWFEKIIPCPYVYAFPNFGGAILDGKLEGWLTANFTIGTTKQKSSSQLDQVYNILKEVGFRPKTESDIKGWLMTHFAYNAGMLAEAARQDGFQKMTHSFSGLSKMHLLMRECVRSIQLLGIDTKKFSEGRAVYQPIWWNVLKSYLIFLIPGLAKSADATMNKDEWLSYLQAIQQLVKNNR